MATPQPSDETLPDGTAFINATDSGTPSIVPPPSLNHVSSQPQRPSIASTVENAIRGSEDPQASLNNGLGNEQGRSPTVTDDNLLAANAFNHSQNELNSLTNTSDATNITRSTGHSTNDTTDEELRDFHCAIDLGGHSGIPNHYRHPGPSTSQFLEYDYTLHLQPKDVYENVDWNGNDDETPPREKYTPGILRDIEDLTARIYPYDDINSKSVEKIKIIELQHDEIANRKIYQNLVEEIGKDENMSRLLKMEFQVDQNFKPEVHLLGTLKPQRLRLKIKIPHMTTRSTNPNSTGKSLFEYSRTVFKDESFSQTEDGGIPISVHETCFMAINSEMILMVRSASNGEASPLPFFPLQHKCSVLHLLVHMISTVVQFSAQPVLDESWMQSTKVVRKMNPPNVQ
ncbi:hypothetical protein BZA77DRAFT_57038 [Pyronema omphalodes]|nr:hypothetical protein BZA77DRAFT_57038 [Pyronema omphalodes]